MDKDNRDDFTFAKLSDLKLPVTFRMFVSRQVAYNTCIRSETKLVDHN